MKGKEKKESLDAQELRKRLALDAMSDPGGLDTSLTMIDKPVAPLGRHLTEDRDRDGQ